MQGLPSYYDYNNIVSSQVQPSVYNVERTGLNRYFERYLLQKAMSVFEFKVPESWNLNYFLYVLYCWGYIAVINTDQFGIIPQACGLKGYNVMYQPTNVTISNPLIRGGIQTPEIGTECSLIRLQPDYGGVLDIVQYYANLMALTAATASTNMMNSKLSYVFGAKSKSFAETFKKMLDKVASGQPAVVTDPKLFGPDGTPLWTTFSQNLRENYIAGDVLADLKKVEQAFCTEVGIPNANTDKRERLITDEVNANNFETRSLATGWMRSLKEGIDMTNRLFGDIISVDWSEEIRNFNKEGGADGAGKTDDTGSV